MKPIKLEMTAFGSYAQLTTVDFRQLGHCLYLITGDTGAGKTTIFDGIMFALYGVASGQGDNKYRTFEMMHCDYVDKSEDTLINLEFEHMGRACTVERKFHFRKKRGTGEYEKTTPTAKLWEPDREVLEGTDAVTARITELLGMSADQFRKVAMLAQGEFKKFLDADSDEKNQILGELFDNSAYVWYQEIFDRARKKLFQRRLEEGDARIKRAMEDFLFPANLMEEEQEVFTPGHSGLEEALEALAEQDWAQQKKLERELSDCRKEENTLRQALGKGEEQNKKLDELAAKRDIFHKLQEKQPEMMRQREQADQVERALHLVRPKEILFQKAREQYQKMEAEIQKLTVKVDQLKMEKSRKEELLAACKEENEPALERLGNEIAEIEKALPQYDELKAKSTARQAENKAAEKTRKARELVETNKKQAEEEISRLKKQIQELDGIEGLVKERQAAFVDAGKDLDKLTAEGGIQDQTKEIYSREKELKKEQAALQRLIAKAADLEEAYHNIYQAFIKGQAGLLAKDLEQELQEKKEAACPVCRTVFRSPVPHSFAELVEGTPEQGAVDQAKAAFEKKEKERQKSSDCVTRQEAEIKGLKEVVLGRLRELRPDCPDWEDLEGTSYLEKLIREQKAQKERAQRGYEEAEAQCRLLEKLKKEQAGKEKELKDFAENLEAYRDQEQKHEIESSRLAAAMEELKKRLTYPDKGAAKARQKELQAEKDSRAKNLGDAQKAYEAVEKQFHSDSGALVSNQNSLPGFREERDEAESALLAELKLQGFSGMDQVRLLLEQAGETDADAERWLKLKKKEQESYDNDLKNTQQRIRELEQETEHVERTDLEQLKARIARLETGHEEIQSRLDQCRRQYENHRKTAVTVKEANQVLKDTESAWQRLNSLADLAIGVNSEGGKLSFDRYVMGYVFKEVLDMANQRLDIMSGGRYELIHERSAGRNNAKAGLEITVLDRTTGKCRSASSLSGGESFFVSLALALGLSDVVQNHAGGKRLDALFIDEGFGTLDDGVLDHALAVLNQLTEGQRLVGIISHVAKLEESIPQQIQVRNSERGSSLRIVG